VVGWFRPKNPGTSASYPSQTLQQRNDASVLNRLQGLGLLSSVVQLKPTRRPSHFSNFQQSVKDVLEVITSSEPTMTYRITPFGIKFLDFMTPIEQMPKPEESKQV
jgi:hypothetical protein